MNTHIQQSERPGYLARVLAIGGRDGSLGEKELRVLRGVMHRIGASNADLTEAIRWHRDGRAVPPLRSPLSRMQNVQDMVMVALADGELGDAEAKPIESLAATLRYSQADMDIIVKRSEAELARVLQAVPDAGGIGALFAADEKPAPPPVPQRQRVESAAETAPIAEAAVPESAVQDAEAEVAEEVLEEPAAPADASGACMPAAEDVTGCASCREASGEGESYCFGAQTGEPNIWGCRLLGMAWVPGAAWLGYGTFEDGYSFVFDREQIGEALADAMERVAGCPYFDDAQAMAALVELPRAANLMGRWTLREVSPGADGEQVSRMEYVHGCAVKRICRANGVDPVGANQAAKLIRRIDSRM